MQRNAVNRRTSVGSGSSEKSRRTLWADPFYVRLEAEPRSEWRFPFPSLTACLHSAAAFNFTLYNFLQLAGFLSKEEGASKDDGSYKSSRREDVR